MRDNDNDVLIEGILRSKIPRNKRKSSENLEESMIWTWVLFFGILCFALFGGK